MGFSHVNIDIFWEKEHNSTWCGHKYQQSGLAVDARSREVDVDVCAARADKTRHHTSSRQKEGCRKILEEPL